MLPWLVYNAWIILEIYTKVLLAAISSRDELIVQLVLSELHASTEHHEAKTASNNWFILFCSWCNFSLLYGRLVPLSNAG